MLSQLISSHRSNTRVRFLSLIACLLLQCSLFQLVFQLVLSIILILPAKAAVDEIEEINRQILMREVELERFSINFRKYNNVQGRWRGWRYFLFQESNSGLVAAGLTKQIVDRERVIRNANVFSVSSAGKVSYEPNATSRVSQEKGLVLQGLGQTIGAMGSGLELGINYYHGHQAHKRGYGSKESIAKVLGIRNDLSDLFSKRDRAISVANLSADELAIAAAEERVLRDITDMGVQEYADYHVAAKRFRGFQDSLYIFDIAKNTTGAVGNLVNLVQTHERRPHLSGGAGVLTTISGAFIMTTPLLAQGVGKLVARSHKRALRPVVAGILPHTVEDLEQHRRELSDLVKNLRPEFGQASCSSKSVALLAAYDLEASQRRKQFALSTREIRAGTRSATENVRAGLLVGSTKVALGTTNMIGGWHYPHAAHKSNSVIEGGTIAYAAGSYFAVGENLRLRVVDELNRKRLGSRGELPAQVLAEKFKALDQLETQLQTCSVKP
ncbi:hypothetical protein BH11CYA1_BH11CYA1_31770 [soil metagenome]